MASRLLKKISSGILGAYLAFAPMNLKAEEPTKEPDKTSQSIPQTTPQLPPNNQNNSQLEENILNRFTFSSRFDLLSKYMFRGIPFNEDPVIQPIQTLTYEDQILGKFQLIGFENINLKKMEGQKANFNEADVIASWERVFKENYGFGLRVAYFANPYTDIPSTTELGASFFLPKVLLSPRLAVSHDFDEGDENEDAGKGWNTELALTYEQPIGKQKLIFTETVGYHGGFDKTTRYYGNKGLYSTLSLTFPLTILSRDVSKIVDGNLVKEAKDAIIFTPNINWNFPITDKDDQPSVKDRFYGGFSLEFKF